MFLHRFRLSGLSQPPMLTDLIALTAMCQALRLRLFGSIGDRLSIPKDIAASGKNSITVAVGRLGGPGAAIAPQQKLTRRSEPERSQRGQSRLLRSLSSDG